MLTRLSFLGSVTLDVQLECLNVIVLTVYLFMYWAMIILVLHNLKHTL